MTTEYKKNIEEFDQKIKELIALKEKYIEMVEKLEAIYERNARGEGE